MAVVQEWTLPEVAERLSCSPGMVAYLCNLGILPSRTITARRIRLCSPDNLATYKRRRQALAKAGVPLARWAEVSKQFEEVK